MVIKIATAQGSRLTSEHLAAYSSKLQPLLATGTSDLAKRQLDWQDLETPFLETPRRHHPARRPYSAPKEPWLGFRI